MSKPAFAVCEQQRHRSACGAVLFDQHKCYSKCSNISNTFLFLLSNTMLVFRAGIYKMLVRIANREDPDQTASSEAV